MHVAKRKSHLQMQMDRSVCVDAIFCGRMTLCTIVDEPARQVYPRIIFHQTSLVFFIL